MRKYRLCLGMFCLLLLQFGVDMSAQEPTNRMTDSEDIVRVKIGIRISSDDAIRRAKADDRLKIGDELRIYIQPEFNEAMIYIIYRNQQQLIPLYTARHENSRKIPIILPSQEATYRVDGQSPEERLTIVCSPEPLPELEEFLQAHTQEQEQPSKAWEDLEEALREQSKVDLSESISRPWGIAGAVRAVDPFLVKLPIFSGKTFVIKKYEFLVEK